MRAPVGAKISVSRICSFSRLQVLFLSFYLSTLFRLPLSGSGLMSWLLQKVSLFVGQPCAHTSEIDETRPEWPDISPEAPSALIPELISKKHVHTSSINGIQIDQQEDLSNLPPPKSAK